MKNKALKHYKRKKFFYRLFMLKSPRSGVMFGIAWLSMVAVLMPAILFLLLAFGDVISDIDSAHINLLTVILGIWTVSLPLFIYGFKLCFLGIYRMFRSVCKYKSICRISGAAATIFLPLLSLLLFLIMLFRKRFAGALFALAGAVFYTLSQFQYINIIAALLAGTGCTLTALAFWKEKHKISFSFLIPLVIAAIAHFSLYGYNIKLQKDVQNCRNKLSQIIGRPVEIKDFFRREKAGFPIDREPLKTLIASKPDTQTDEYEFENTAVAKIKLFAYQKKYPVFVKALKEFLQLPVSAVSHPISENSMLSAVLMPELSTWREAARYLAMNITANPTDKQQVTQNNKNLITLRSWALQDSLFLPHLVAIAIEGIRLNALENVIVSGNFTKTEIEKLIGPPVDWLKYMKFALGDEGTTFETVVKYLSSSDITALGNEYKPVNSIKTYMPLFFRVLLMRDYRFSLRKYIEICSVPVHLPGLKKAELVILDESEMQRNFYILSALLQPSGESMFRHESQIRNTHQMALLAVEVMEYRKQHGKLPGDLTFLPEIPLSKWDHKPLMYAKTSDGFRIFSHTDKGKKPDAEDWQYSYLVRLPMVTGTIPQGVSYGK